MRRVTPPDDSPSTVLRAMLRRRGFATSEDVVAWSRRTYADTRYHLYSGVFSRIDQHKVPTVYRLETLRAATGLSRADLYALNGIDLNLLPLHSGLLHVNRTHPIQSMPPTSSRATLLPDRLTPAAMPAPTMPLSDIVSRWSAQEQAQIDACRAVPERSCMYVQVGLDDGKSYPEIAPGMILQVDTRDTADVGNGGLYVFEHPYGYSVCRAVVEPDDTIVLLSSSRGLYPELIFPRALVRVLGRARACCGRIADVRVPARTTEAQLRRVYRDNRARPTLVPPLSDAVRRSTSDLLRVQRQRLGLSYEEFAQMARRLRDVVGAQFSVSAARVHELIHDAPTLVERPAVVYALAACFALEFDDVLASLGIDVRATDAMEQVLAGVRARPAGYLAALFGEHAVAADLLSRWLEWPPIVSVLGPDPRGSIFYFNQPIRSIEPLIKSHAFLVVDGKETTVATVMNGRPVAELSEWERPIYLLLTRQGYLCGYCERDEKTISIVAHPRASDQRRRAFAVREEADVIGRVSAVATLL